MLIFDHFIEQVLFVVSCVCKGGFSGSGWIDE